MMQQYNNESDEEYQNLLRDSTARDMNERNIAQNDSFLSYNENYEDKSQLNNAENSTVVQDHL